MRTDSTGIVGVADTLSTIMYALAGWILIAVGVVGGARSLSALTGGEPLALVGLGLAFVVISLGVVVNPDLRRRIDRRHGIYRFGAVRSVDQRVFRPEEGTVERCVECDDPTDHGLVRRYRGEYAVAGLPVYTRSIGYNHYCPDCAGTDALGTGVPDEVTVTRRSPVTAPPSDDRSSDQTVRETDEETPPEASAADETEEYSLDRS